MSDPNPPATPPGPTPPPTDPPPDDASPGATSSPDPASPSTTPPASSATAPAEDSPADTPADAKADGESPTVDDTVAANVDAPAQPPGGAGATPPQADPPATGDSPIGDKPSGGSPTSDGPIGEGLAVEDTVAANVDAPAQAAGSGSVAPPAASADAKAKADVDGPTVDKPGVPAGEPAKTSTDSPTEAIPAADGVDATRELPAVGGKKDVTDAEKDASATGDRETSGGDGDKDAAGADGDKDGATAAEGDGSGSGETPGVVRKRRNPWPTVGTLAAVLVILAGIGYFGGLGPLNRLSTTRDLNPPNQVSGLNRITDQATRERLQLDQTRDALRRINDGKKASVEAYGEPAGDKLFMIIALRGKVDIDKEIRDSGATGDQVKKAGKSTCATSVQDIPTSCYRGSNTLTVIAQGLTDKADVDAVAAVADEAFDAMK